MTSQMVHAYTSLAQIIYRTVAMLHARMSGRGF
jgi:hypothetical protein